MTSQLAYMKDMETKSDHRNKALEEEKRALQELVNTLEGQNETLVKELDSHVRESELVRQKLDRRGRVNELKATFDRTVNDSYINLVRTRSPVEPKIINNNSEMFYKQKTAVNPHYTFSDNQLPQF